MLTTTLALASLLPAQPATPQFEIRDGDRIVWIGSTLVEREQRYGYWETALHVAFADKQFTLRNLGWSGDTVFGEARGRFDFNNAEMCFKQLVDQTLKLKPTIIFVSYGTNESFEGEAGLEKFEKGLNKLLDAIKPAKARIVLFTPLPMIQGKKPHPHNAMLKRYGLVVAKVAAARGHQLADLLQCATEHQFDINPLDAVTDNGMHLNELGYEFHSWAFLASLGLEWKIGKKDIKPLRDAIVEKNELFFHRWRPQNETYLFGFRKHEQGKNAKEVAEFDPLVAKAEEKIEELRKKLLTK